MNQLTVSCPHCAKPSRLDADKLPNQPAVFPCPHCQGRVVVDKSKQAADPQPATAPPSPSPSTTENKTPAVQPTAPDRRFAALPNDAILPSGIIVGQDQSTIDEIRTVLAALGSDVEQVASPAIARQMIIEESPELCIIADDGNNTTPSPSMAELTGLHPRFRRRLYLVLIADDVRSGDGNTAFMHEVNLVLARQELSQLSAALYSGLIPRAALPSVPRGDRDEGHDLSDRSPEDVSVCVLGPHESPTTPFPDPGAVRQSRSPLPARYSPWQPLPRASSSSTTSAARSGNPARGPT